MEDGKLGRLFEHVFVFGHSDPLSALPPQQWQQCFGFELLRHQACDISHDCQLFRMLLFLEDRKLELLFEHMLSYSYADALSILSPFQR